MIDRCISCGEPIPEGRQVCPECEKGINMDSSEQFTGLEMAQIFSAIYRLKEYEALGSIDRLRELAEADKDGRCVILPCKVGECRTDNSGDGITVVGFHYDEWAGWSVIYRYIDEAANGDALCAVNAVYWENNMTRAEAEAKLKGERK